MVKTSAGILTFRITKQGEIEVLLVHPGGPFYQKKDVGAWSIPKGEYTEQEDPLEVAKREFTEETGNVISKKLFTPLKTVKSRGSKMLTAWTIQENFEPGYICSNSFELEWPPKSGKLQRFPEADKAEWFSIKQAKVKIISYQRPLIEELENLLSTNK